MLDARWYSIRNYVPSQYMAMQLMKQCPCHTYYSRIQLLVPRMMNRRLVFSLARALPLSSLLAVFDGDRLGMEVFVQCLGAEILAEAALLAAAKGRSHIRLVVSVDKDGPPRGARRRGGRH